MPKDRVAVTRRGFMISVGTGGLAAAAAVGAAIIETGQSGAVATRGTKPATRGYRVSEHINKYYRTTRV